MSMLHREARDKLLQAAAEVMAVEHSQSASADTINYADTRLDLCARLYVEAIGPREVEEPERQYGQTLHGRDTEEEEEEE